MTTQLERSLQTEIMLRLNRYPVVPISVPNGLWIPARSPAEQALVGRIVRRMRDDGMLTPGAPDLVLMGQKGALCVELKRAASRDLFMRRPKGRLSPEQRVFRDRCRDADVPYIVAYDWADVECSLGRSGGSSACIDADPAISPRPGRAHWLSSARRSPSVGVLPGIAIVGA
jgi:hypothetical protein